MHTSFACTSQMLMCIYLGFITHNTCTHNASPKKHSHTHADACKRVFKSCATERLKSPHHERNKSHATERLNLHYVGFS